MAWVDATTDDAGVVAGLASSGQAGTSEVKRGHTTRKINSS